MPSVEGPRGHEIGRIREEEPISLVRDEELMASITEAIPRDTTLLTKLAKTAKEEFATFKTEVSSYQSAFEEPFMQREINQLNAEINEISSEVNAKEGLIRKLNSAWKKFSFSITGKGQQRKSKLNKAQSELDVLKRKQSQKLSIQSEVLPLYKRINKRVNDLTSVDIDKAMYEIYEKGVKILGEKPNQSDFEILNKDRLTDPLMLKTIEVLSERESSKSGQKAQINKLKITSFHKVYPEARIVFYQLTAPESRISEMLLSSKKILTSMGQDNFSKIIKKHQMSIEKKKSEIRDLANQIKKLKYYLDNKQPVIDKIENKITEDEIAKLKHVQKNIYIEIEEIESIIDGIQSKQFDFYEPLIIDSILEPLSAAIEYYEGVGKVKKELKDVQKSSDLVKELNLLKKIITSPGKAKSSFKKKSQDVLKLLTT